MDLPLYQVDAFASRPFSGNPAAVVPLDEWLPDTLMQEIARENNLSETAFFTPRGADFHIRWFTPGGEINLCGHATLASAFVLFHELGYVRDEILFDSASGPLKVSREAAAPPGARGAVPAAPPEAAAPLLTLDFPAWPPRPVQEYPPALAQALNREIVSVHEYRDLLVELEDESAVRNLHPDFGLLRELGQCVIVTARGTDADFVSRFFAPHLGIDEDPVTGSAHTQLIPFWGARLNKKDLYAKQLSRRGGELWCTWAGDRVTISGACAFFLKGTISI
ncbi:PhzF family phenazine biosynthesis protein [Dinghuibacter silviterrae]|uniref:PhzF family phenazine biosynthesis protein n=1 Tax=Dinghuibacter silviterrae TaxID=1539049 RepID=A0A4R8DT93_9BACT|nr:PhzF family phenazine biosynthesis protein [Dinghuibacter silviterrae]TDX00637.1 PhzF family phenazine biosynthesis protein [Dinghuibacter silviterrae]